MGGCFSVAGDVRGGMEAVGGGGGGRSHGGAAAQQGGPNDAVDHFFQARGLRGLYTPIEVRGKMRAATCICSPVVGTWERRGFGWLRFWFFGGGIGVLLLRNFVGFGEELGFCCFVDGWAVLEIGIRILG
jgi:hypothetical protein